MQVNGQKTKLYIQPYLPIASPEGLETNND